LIIQDVLIEIIIGLIIAAIIGAGTSFWILIKCVHKQREDIKLMKKATLIAFSFIVKDTREFHGQDMTDIEQLYRDLINSE
jgi:hypothetical protein